MTDRKEITLGAISYLATALDNLAFAAVRSYTIAGTTLVTGDLIKAEIHLMRALREVRKAKKHNKKDLKELS